MNMSHYEWLGYWMYVHIFKSLLTLIYKHNMVGEFFLKTDRDFQKDTWRFLLKKEEMQRRQITSLAEQLNEILKDPLSSLKGLGCHTLCNSCSLWQKGEPRLPSLLHWSFSLEKSLLPWPSGPSPTKWMQPFLFFQWSLSKCLFSYSALN